MSRVSGERAGDVVRNEHIWILGEDGEIFGLVGKVLGDGIVHAFLELIRLEARWPGLTRPHHPGPEIRMNGGPPGI